MKTAVYNLEGKQIGDIELSDAIFAREWNADLVHQVVVSLQANARRPWAHAKGRGEVHGGGRKPWKQKGTGRARQGSIRAPQWKGGGVSHGPVKFRNYSQTITKQQGRAALYSILSKKLSEGELKVVDGLSLKNPKTKEMASALKTFFSSKQVPSTLLISTPANKLVTRTARNIAKVTVVTSRSLNVHDLLAHKNVVVEKEAVIAIK